MAPFGQRWICIPALLVPIVLVSAPAAEAAPLRGACDVGTGRLCGDAGSDTEPGARAAIAARRVIEPPPGATVPLQPCKEAPDGLCGSIEVPLDRAQPELGTTRIGFEWYPHRDHSKKAFGTLVPNPGGPGQSTVPSREDWFLLFAPVRDIYDLLLIDDRGRGVSGAIDCPAAQHGIGDYFAGIAACGAQLGAAADDYGTAAVADDVDAVRAALGIDKLTYYGLSYGGVDVEAYATRHGSHLAAVVGDAPWTSLVDPMQRFVAPATVRDVVRSCSNALGCSARNPNPKATLRWLAKRLQRTPLVGTGIDFTGKAQRVVLDEASTIRLLAHNASGFVNFLMRSSGGFAAPGELTAAARALKQRDRVPLLRLAAEQLSTASFPADAGEATGFSQGAYLATFCTDSLQLYDTTAPPDVRRSQYDAALANLPKDTFAPFSIAGYAKFLREGLYGADTCIPWPTPRKDVLPSQESYPNAPLLALNGDMDATDPTEYTLEYKNRWPRHQFVEVAGAGHGVLLWSACARKLIYRFLRTHDAGDTSCAKVPIPSFATADFPQRVAKATKARTARGGLASGLARKVATVTAATVVDAFKRARLGGTPIKTSGLRGGAFRVKTMKGSETLIAQLDAARFASDLAVTGRATWTIKGALAAGVRIQGRAVGWLRVAGPLLVTTRDMLTVSGRINGRRVALLVPAT